MTGFLGEQTRLKCITLSINYSKKIYLHNALTYMLQLEMLKNILVHVEISIKLD